MRAKRHAEPEKARAAAKAFRLANPERTKAHDSRSNAKRQLSGYKKAYRAAHPGKEAAALRAKRAADPEVARKRDREWYAKNAETVQAKKLAWRRTHREQANSSTRKSRRKKPTGHWNGQQYAWRKANPDRWAVIVNSAVQRRRLRLLGQESTLTTDGWKAILEVFGHACAYCLRTGVKLEQEHVIPVSKGGGHTEDNVVPACLKCNRRKSARGPLALVNAA
jgi:5-methylcytosine-specific restriction endonuclease McrA